MNFLLDIEFKRGDAVLFVKRYWIRYVYLDTIALSPAYGETIIHGKMNSTLQDAKEWFLAKHPRYEPIKMRELSDKNQ